MGGLRFLTSASLGLVASLAMATTASAATQFWGITGEEHLNTYTLNTGVYGDARTMTHQLVGLGEIGETVYGDTGDQLYKFSSPLTSGTLTAIGGTEDCSGTTHCDFIDMGSTGTGLTGGGGALYGIDFTSTTVRGVTTDGAILYSINATTGAVHDIGSLGLSGAALTGLGTRVSADTAAEADSGMSTGSNTLYFVDGNTLYTINTATGAATSDGTINIAGLDIGALVVGANGTLYAGSNDCKQAVCGTDHKAMYTLTIHPTGVVATYVSEVSPNTPTVAFLGLAKVLPEPSEWALMLAGVGAVGGVLRARRRKAVIAG